MGKLAALWASIDGQKTHIASGLGIVVILAHHFLHIDLPGMTYDDAQWLNQVYALIVVMCGRDALKKLQPDSNKAPKA